MLQEQIPWRSGYQFQSKKIWMKVRRLPFFLLIGSTRTQGFFFWNSVVLWIQVRPRTLNTAFSVFARVVQLTVRIAGNCLPDIPHDMCCLWLPLSTFFTSVQGVLFPRSCQRSHRSFTEPFLDHSFRATTSFDQIIPLGEEVTAPDRRCRKVLLISSFEFLRACSSVSPLSETDRRVHWQT